MGEVMATLWAEHAVPPLAPALEPLRGWSRERLVDVMQRFRSQASLALRKAGLLLVLGLTSDSQIWTGLGVPPEGAVDFLSVVMPMVVLSDMHYISKVTFLFSICDFNSVGNVKRSEFYIGLRAIVRGLQRFFPSAGKPTAEMIEKATDAVFKKIDINHSGELELQEIVTFGYRSHSLRKMLVPFPSSDTRQFEELTYFPGTNRRREQARDAQVEKADKRSIQMRLKLTPDEGNDRRQSNKLTRRDKPWQEPVIVTKPRTFIVYTVFCRLAYNGVAPAGELYKLVHNRQTLEEVCEGAYDQLQQENWSDRRADPSVRARVIGGISTYFETAAKELKKLPPDEQVSLHAFLCIVWPRVSDREVNQGLKFCRMFQAIAALRELTRSKESTLTNAEYDPSAHQPAFDVDRDDINAIFEALDVNGDGKLSLRELTAEGTVSVEDAEKLLRLWDHDSTTELSKGEVLNIVFGINQVVQRQIKSLFFTSVTT